KPDEITYPRTQVGGDATSEVALKAGDTVSIGNLWVSMLLASSNQSAIVLADNSGVSREKFISLMNKKADELGLQKTHFAEIAGLNPNNVSTPNEAALMGAAAFARDKIAEATRYTAYSFTVMGRNGLPRTVNVTNRNVSLQAFQPDAVKVGYLTE